VASAIEPGAVIDGKYRVIRRIGEGGMGTVYEGENVRIERKVAIKVLHAHVASTPEFAQRFEREARASARIGSPNVCDVLDLGDLPNGDRFIVMEYLEGESLEERLDKGLLTATELAPIAFEILEGLGTMHQAGVVHRDLKPANIFLSRRGKSETVKILDFGVAKILPRADEPSEMTSTGMMMGTPLYMSPEQARGARDVDGRTDLYAASVIFYRALTGEMPHSGDNLHELLFKIVLEEPKPIREIVPEVDEVFADIVTRGLARDADYRFSSAREYQEEIASWGASLGRSSLQFALTLTSEPPPLKSLSGGFPASKVRPPITGPQPRSEKVGPATPALAKTQAEGAVSSARLSGMKQPSGGTPVVWSEDAPEIAKKALAELEARRKASTSGNTQILDTKSPVPSSVPSPTPSAGPPVAPPAPNRIPLIGALALFVIAAVVVGLRLTGSGTPTGSAQAASTTQVVADPPPVVPPPPPTPLTSPEPIPEPAASASTSSSPTPVAVTPRVATPTHKTPVAASASAAKSAAPPVVASSAPVTPPPATSGTARKFRKSIE
jgi:serine/threonine protein kinase